MNYLQTHSQNELINNFGDTGEKEQENTPPAPVVTPSLNDSIPSYGDTRFSDQANTAFSEQYFTPILRKRALDYTNGVSSKAIWNTLGTDQVLTLYWENRQLKNGQGIVFDDLRITSYPLNSSKSFLGVTISEPLTSGVITAYPGCVGFGNTTHPRSCGEGDEHGKFFSGSHIYSQRWERLNNIDTEQAIQNSRYLSSVDDIRYALSVKVYAGNIMLPSDLKKATEHPSLAFEMSVSKIPGDFSDNACKVNRAAQYSNNLTIELTQKGLTHNDLSLPEVCKIDSNELQHYYINVRAVNVGNDEISESLCNGAASRCRFEIFSYLD